MIVGGNIVQYGTIQQSVSQSQSSTVPYICCSGDGVRRQSVTTLENMCSAR